MSQEAINPNRGRVNVKRVKMILTNRYDPDVRVFKEAKYLVSKGFDVEILCWDRQREFGDRSVEVNEGIKIRRFYPYAKYGSGIKQLNAFFMFTKQVRAYLAGEDYEYLHCHDLDGAIVGCVVKAKAAKLIFDMHEIYELQRKKQMIRSLVRKLVNFIQKKSDNIIYINEAQVRLMSKENRPKAIFLPNYPDLENYCETKINHGGKLRVGYIGAVRQYNELKNLMDACKNLNNVTVAIHGTGVAYEQLNKIKDNYPNVTVTGRFHYTESAKLYSQIDVLYAVYPITEQNKVGLPVKLFEAIVMKTPVISNRNIALGDFLTEKNIGFTVDGNDVDEIKRLVEMIGKDRSLLQEKIDSIEKIQYSYSWNEIVKNLDKIYKSN